jgi:radical SAM protein with 4Fe4S-binding SPASM domain
MQHQRENLIPLEALRLKRREAPNSAYDPPNPDGLARHIVEGKRELDRVTRNDLSTLSELNRAAPDAPSLHDGSSHIEEDGPLPLVRTLSHRLVDGRHLWIAVHEGAAIVLDDEEDAVFALLRSGLSPVAAVGELAGELDDASRWGAVTGVIGRLAESGFIRGIQGNVDAATVAPRRFMRLHLTQRCNLSCIHCYADSSPHVSSDGELPVERWLRLIDDFARVGGERVLFTGGEALAYSGCDILLRRAKERGLFVTLFSNGLLVGRHLDVIRECVNEVQISVDGPDAATNDPIRGDGSFDRAIHAIDLLVGAGVRTRIGMVVMQRNWDSMKSGFLAFARRWQGKNVEFRVGYGLTHHGRGQDIHDELSVNETRPVVERLMAEVEGEKDESIARSTKGCGYGEQIVVAPDGSIHPCHLLDGAITHIDQKPIEELVGFLEEQAHEYDVDHNVGCRSCDIRNLCGGTCRILNGKATGNRRITNCTAFDKLQRLHNLVQTFDATSE